MRVGMVTGSFDPITNGHAWVIDTASSMVDELWVVVAANPNKTCMFSVTERMQMVRETCDGMQEADSIYVSSSYNELITTVASKYHCNVIFRGLRSAEDFAYENQMLMVNRKINPLIETVFLIPPRDLTEISSSMVKGLTKFAGWQRIASMYVHPTVLSRLEEKSQ